MRQRQLGGEHLALDAARREIVVIVEPDLADRASWKLLGTSERTV